MPLFMDVHHGMDGLDDAKAAAAHALDLEHQAKHGVKFLRYWFDADRGEVFCLSDAPSSEAALAVHRDAGHPADDIFEVKERE